MVLRRLGRGAECVPSCIEERAGKSQVPRSRRYRRGHVGGNRAHSTTCPPDCDKSLHSFRIAPEPHARRRRVASVRDDSLLAQPRARLRPGRTRTSVSSAGNAANVDTPLAHSISHAGRCIFAELPIRPQCILQPIRPLRPPDWKPTRGISRDPAHASISSTDGTG